MNVAAVFPPSVSKEVRALALPWLACLSCLIVPAFLNAPMWLGGLSVPAYFLGTAALGGLSMGHEYSDRTLSLLLTLPARRERLFAIKLGVLAVMLLSLWGAATTLVFGDSRLSDESSDLAALLTLLCGLFLAPWLTMACRNPIAGAVFALSVPGVLIVAGEILGLSLYGFGADADQFTVTFVIFGTIGLCAVGAVMGWWTFTRLQAIEGPGQDVRLPRWLRALAAPTAVDRVTRRHPLWLLIKKDIALQQLPIVLAILYVLAWLVTEALTSFTHNIEYRQTLGALTLPYGILLAMLIGSSGSAAERQIGTLEWQNLLPIAPWKQWAVKVGMLFGLAITLALGVPVALLYLSGLVRPTSIVSLMAAWSATTIVIAATAVSLYVSTISRSALRALVTAIPATLGSLWFMHAVASSFGGVQKDAMLILVTGFLIIALTFAHANHRSAERPGRRVAVQVLFMAAFVTITVAAAAVWAAS